MAFKGSWNANSACPNWITQLAYVKDGPAGVNRVWGMNCAHSTFTKQLWQEELRSTKAFKSKAPSKELSPVDCPYPFTEMKSNCCQERGDGNRGDSARRDNGMFAFASGCLSMHETYYVGLLICYQLSTQGRLVLIKALNQEFVSDQQPHHVHVLLKIRVLGKLNMLGTSKKIHIISIT